MRTERAHTGRGRSGAHLAEVRCESLCVHVFYLFFFLQEGRRGSKEGRSRHSIFSRHQQVIPGHERAATVGETDGWIRHGESRGGERKVQGAGCTVLARARLNAFILTTQCVKQRTPPQKNPQVVQRKFRNAGGRKSSGGLVKSFTEGETGQPAAAGGWSRWSG